MTALQSEHAQDKRVLADESTRAQKELHKQWQADRAEALVTQQEKLTAAHEAAMQARCIAALTRAPVPPVRVCVYSPSGCAAAAQRGLGCIRGQVP